jgi:hypothetical protein
MIANRMPDRRAATSFWSGRHNRPAPDFDNYSFRWQKSFFAGVKSFFGWLAHTRTQTSLVSLENSDLPVIASPFGLWHASCTNEGDRGDVTLTWYRQEIPDGTTKRTDWEDVWSLDRPCVYAQAIANAATTVHLIVRSLKTRVLTPMPSFFPNCL